jgi:Na+/proline symporter
LDQEQILSPKLILAFVLGYFALLLAVAWYTGRKSSNQSFFIGSKSSPWYLVAFGMIGASVSGVTFISIPGAVGNAASPNFAFSYMQMAMGYVLGYVVIALVLMPLYYRLNLTSIYTYLEQRFGTFSHKTGATFFLISRTIGSAFRLYLVAIVLQMFVFDHWGLPFVFTVAFTLLLIWIYTRKGGIHTVVWTDILQTVFMLLSVVITIYYISSDMGLSVGGLVNMVVDSQYSQMFFWDPKADSYFWKQFIGGALIAIAMTGLDQDMMQKNNSCKNIGEAQLNMFSSSFVFLFANLLFVSVGAMLYLYAASKGIAIPEKTDYLFPTLAFKYFTPFAGIVFIIGLIAAAYSSVDSALTALTTSVCVDLLGFEKEQLKTEAQLQQTRERVHIGVTMVMFLVVVAFKYVLSADVVSAVFKIAGFTYGPLLGLFTFGILTKRSIQDNLAPLVCIAAPVLCVILNANSTDWFGGYKFGIEILLLNGGLTFAGLWLISKRGELVVGK